MTKKVRQVVSKFMSKFEKVHNVLVLTLIASGIMSSTAYAADQPKLVSGTVALFQAITGWLLIIIPVGAGAMLGYQALQKSLTDDNAVIAEKNKFMKNVVIGAAIAETASGLITVVLSFYK